MALDKLSRTTGLDSPTQETLVSGSYLFQTLSPSLQAFQFTDEHGEVCPAGWKPGQKTMKPDPKGSQDYFKAAN